MTSFTEADLRKRCEVAGITIDEGRIESTVRDMERTLTALATFDTRKHEWGEAATTFDPRRGWKS